jgi:hypothetical protein
MSLADFAKNVVPDEYSLLRWALYDSQQLNTNCAVQSLKLHLETILGRNIDQKDFTALAYKMGVWKPGGAKIPQMKEMADNLGLRSNLKSVDDLSRLEQGKKYLIGLEPSEINANTLEELPTGPGHAYIIEPMKDGRFKVWDPESLSGEPIIRDAGVINNAMDHGNKVLEFEPNEAQNPTLISENLNKGVDSLSPNDYAPVEADIPFDPDAAEYAALGSAESTSNLDDLPSDVSNSLFEINTDVENLVATGGYIALMQFYKDNPKKQKNVTKVALTLGALDSVLDLNDKKVSLDFEHIELSPLLITSLAYYISQVASKSRNLTIQKTALGFSKLLSKGFKVVEYAGYAAIGIEGIDFLFDAGLTDLFIELVDSATFLDFLGNAADGADVFDGLFSLGVGIFLARFVRDVFEDINEDDVEKVKQLERKLAPKKTLAKLLKLNVPAPMLVGPYSEMIREGG